MKRIFVTIALMLVMSVSLCVGLVVTAQDAEARSFSSSGRSYSSSSKSSGSFWSKPKSSSSYSKPKPKVIEKRTVIYRNSTPTVIHTAPAAGGGLGTSLIGGAVGGIGGAMLYDAMTNDEGMSKEEVEQKLEEQRQQMTQEQLLEQNRQLMLQLQQLQQKPAVQ